MPKKMKVLEGTFMPNSSKISSGTIKSRIFRLMISKRNVDKKRIAINFSKKIGYQKKQFKNSLLVNLKFKNPIPKIQS
jgi:hypothetical protein